MLKSPFRNMYNSIKYKVNALILLKEMQIDFSLTFLEWSRT